MIDKLSNNWTVLSNEEMDNVKGGMEFEDPNTFAIEDPNGYMDMWHHDPQMMFHWYEEAGYSRGQTIYHLRKFIRSYYGGC